jgi:hypothetical protein
MISVPLGGEGTAQLGRRTAAGGVEDEVPAAHPVGHVLAGVVDDVVGADRADQVDLGRAGYPGHGTPWPAGPRTTPPRRPPDDQDALSRLDLANIAQPLESREPRDGDGRRLLKAEGGRLARELVLRCARVLGEGAVAPAELGGDLGAFDDEGFLELILELEQCQDGGVRPRGRDGV